MATETRPERAKVARESTVGLEKQGLDPKGSIHWNLIAPELMKAASRLDEGEFAARGPFVAVTSTRPLTGTVPRVPSPALAVMSAVIAPDVERTFVPLNVISARPVVLPSNGITRPP